MVKNSLATGVALMLVVWLVGCSDPLNTPLPEDMAKIDTIKPQLEKLPEVDRKLLISYLIRRSMPDVFPATSKDVQPLSAVTVGQAIDAQRIFDADQALKATAEKAVAAQLKAEQEVAAKVLQALVSVSLVRKRIEVERGYSGIEMDRNLSISFRFKNNSGKNIAGVKGRVEARDLFGDAISGFQISNDQSIKVGESITWVGTRSVKFPSGSNNDEKLVELTDDKFTIIWEPQVIVFEDGTKANRPN